MTALSLGAAIDNLQRAAAKVLELAPLRDDARARALAAEQDAYFETTVTPDTVSITLVAGSERAEVFRVTDGPSTFDEEPST